jgi:hypothetical protein
VQQLTICGASRAIKRKARKDSHQIFKSACRIEAGSSGTLAMTIVVGDESQVLFVSGGEEFRVSQPARGGYGELVVAWANCSEQEPQGEDIDSTVPTLLAIRCGT